MNIFISGLQDVIDVCGNVEINWVVPMLEEFIHMRNKYAGSGTK